MNSKEANICIIGLGYVGLPLAIEFGKIKKTLGFDINPQRIENLKIGLDKTNEKTFHEIKSSKFLSFSSDMRDLGICNCFIVTVPTPIDKFLNPDLGALKKATIMVGKFLKKGDIVIYESTVYPGKNLN